MKNHSLLYWISTVLFAAFMLMSAYNYLTQPDMKAAFAGLGFTADYFRIELAVAKIFGAIILLIPLSPKWLKVFVYSGFAINLLSAFIAHVAMGYHSYAWLIFSVLTLSLSYYAYINIQKQQIYAKA